MTVSAIIDTHLHLWDPAVLTYPWLEGTPLNRPFLAEDFQVASSGLPVEGAVFVQCDCLPEQSSAEVEFVLAQAVREPRIRAIVAHAPVEIGEAVEEHLERLAAFPIVRGIRRLLQGEADVEFCLHPEFVEGVRQLDLYNLHFEICIYHPQLSAAVELVRRCPEVRFVLDHIGKPGIAAGLMQPWGDQIGEMAALPNVVCKVSGLVTEADHAHWTPAHLRPYVEHVLESFGPERVMFGSDWPVATLASSYNRWVSTLDELVSGASDAERSALFHDNAVRVYRLAG
jgi:L-fuconolactonase